MRGLLVNIYEAKRLGNCSNGGISATCENLVLLGPDAPFGADEVTPAVVILEKSNGYVYARPATTGGELIEKEGMAGPMMGGSFIYTSDSRFPYLYPVPLHDRWETPQYPDFYITPRREK